MDYQTTKKIMMDAYPTLFVCEADVLCHLFFVNGNGYRWKDGELVDVEGTEDAAKSWAGSRRAYREKYLEDRLEQAEDDWSINFYKELLQVAGMPPEEQWAHWKEQRRKELQEGWTDRVMLPDGNVISNIYPLCEYAKILNLPEDIREDWLDAARMALELAPLLRPTKEDDKFLRKAQKLWNKRNAERCQDAEDNLLNHDDG